MCIRDSQNAVRLDLVVHDQNKHHDGPRRLGVQVGRGAPQADNADQVAPDAPVSYTHLDVYKRQHHRWCPRTGKRSRAARRTRRSGSS